MVEIAAEQLLVRRAWNHVRCPATDLKPWNRAKPFIASFAGDAHFPATSGTGSLSVVDAPTPGLVMGHGFIRIDDSKNEFARAACDDLYDNSNSAVLTLDDEIDGGAIVSLRR